MITDQLIRDLRRIVGQTHVSVSRADTELYSYDASLAKGEPSVVVFPSDAREAARVVGLTHQAGIPFVPRGFGTNLSGGTVLSSGGMVICLSRLNRILEISPERRCAVVQPGVTNLELQNALSPLGFFYAPDPASQKVATLGGNVGENSGGPRCLKYGVTTNHVLGMEIILATGELIRIGGSALDPPGYDLRGVMIGSEGTLAIVTEVTVRILPQPESVITLLVIYNNITDAARSVSDIIAAGIVPATLEMMDAPIIKAVEDSYVCGYPRDAAAVLIIEVEGPSVGLKDQALHISELCLQNNCRDIREAKDNSERNRLWEGRRGAFGAVARLAPNYLVNDCTVPRTKLPQALAKVAQISKKYNFEHGNVFHAGDGNLHPLLFFDSRDPDQLHQAKKAGWEIMEACVQLGGTITGEHGIGLEKLEAMRMIFSEADFEAQRALPQAFDPQNLLNPGKVIPKPDQIEATPDPQTDEVISGAPNGRKAAQEIIAKIQKAISEGQALLPTGWGTSRSYGNLSNQSLIPLKSSKLADVVEFDPGNQVITVGAGMTLEALQRHLQTHHQWLPLRPPFSLKRHSVGGLVALGACGPERLYYGAPRDLLLGLRYVDGQGHFISSGGKVVKNVAGYDLTRLMVGSAGTLGMITEVTSRVAMIPEQCKAISANGSLDACVTVAFQIIRSNLSPVFVTAIPKNHEGSEISHRNWKILIGFEGFSKTVEDQLEGSGRLLKKSNPKLMAIEKADYAVHEGLFAQTYTDLDRSAFILRADVPPDEVESFVKTLEGQLADADLFLDFGCGRILAGLEDMSDAAWTQICGISEQYSGHALLEKAPDDFKARHDVFGLSRPEWKIMHRIKTILDPHSIFAPGRLPGKV